MLTKADKEFITKTIHEALTVNIQYERFNKERGLKELKTEDVFLPNFWVQYLPEFMGALRGMQETTDHTKNRACETKEAVAALGGIMLQFEEGIKSVVKFADWSKQKQLAEGIEAKQIQCVVS